MAKEKFVTRHIGPRPKDVKAMLQVIGVGSLDELMDQTIPRSIRLKDMPDLPEGQSEDEYLDEIREIGSKNKIYNSFIGMGYYNTITPSVIHRNILENPSWYTSYTPYQAEISQGRLEALLNFQTVVADLTGLEIANASLLDEGSAAAEAMLMMAGKRSRKQVKAGANKFFVDEKIFPQTLCVLRSRAEPQHIELVTGSYKTFSFTDEFFGALVQYPNDDGQIEDYAAFVEKAHEHNALVAVAADILSLALLSPPGDWGADIAVGSSQRFGLPMGYGGPHAGYFATREKFKRSVPGRLIGVSKDKHGNYAMRMALQTREQHIKRERATSNICTAQAMLATMAGMYAVYHGKEGLTRIARHAHSMAGLLHTELERMGFRQQNTDFFDTLKVELPSEISKENIRDIALGYRINLRYFEDENAVGISTDERTDLEAIHKLTKIFALAANKQISKPLQEPDKFFFQEKFTRSSDFLTLEVFKRYRSETEMMRYIKKLERKDFSLTHSMISLGSCTMKLNAATELFPLSWPEFNALHPFVPKDQALGYYELFERLEHQLNAITGFAATTLQPNSGAAGEFTGLSIIRAYQESRGESHRNVVLVPSSAHGTNPASGIMAGQKVIVVESDANGNIDLNDLKEKAEANSEHLSALMVTYPSTHGVFETEIREICETIHKHGGQVYLDGANMNAQIGLTNPKIIGADVCHLNLHKTFAIPHGGGGPGVGSVSVAEHLVDFLPSHPVIETGGTKGIPAIAAAPFGSSSVLPITYGYIRMLGAQGLKETAEYAILNSNYLASALKKYYQILYSGKNGRVAHEMILECRNFKHDYGISEADIAKRLMDYGFHAPTLSFPVHGTLMVEPTESEAKPELDRFIEAMMAIYEEIMEVAEKKADPKDNVLVNAPHTGEEIASDNWTHPYGRQKAAYPLRWILENKFWPSVGRVDDAYGDRHLMCTCAPIDAYRENLLEVPEMDIE